MSAEMRATSRRMAPMSARSGRLVGGGAETNVALGALELVFCAGLLESGMVARSDRAPALKCAEGGMDFTVSRGASGVTSTKFESSGRSSFKSELRESRFESDIISAPKSMAE